MTESTTTDAAPLTPEQQNKLNRCREILRELQQLVVGVSGGVDSSLLLTLAVEELGTQNVLAATATGLIHPQRDLDDTRRLAGQLGVELVEIDIADLDDPRILENPPDRCYWCKRFIFGELTRLAQQRGIRAVASGSNMDDTADYRPGSRAEKELEIVRPLQLACMTKPDIRAAARQLGVRAADRPSSACLASRVPYGRPLGRDVLQKIETAEESLRELGFEQCRVRDHVDVARIEVPQCQIAQATQQRAEIVHTLKQAGYQYVALDLEGFRSGAMNETLGRK